MYRSGSEYDKLDKWIYSIYDDYNIHKFPIDAKKICQKMKIALVPYSAFSDGGSQSLLQKKSKHAFFVKESKENPSTIYYNDTFGSEGAIRLSTLMHRFVYKLQAYIWIEQLDTI